MSRKKKKRHEEHIDESWLLPYSDLLTLLVALFIVLFAMSSVDTIKFHQLARSLQSSLHGGTGLMDYPSPLPQDQLQSLNIEDALNDQNEKPEFDKPELQKLKEKIDAYIDTQDLGLTVNTLLTDEGLMLTLVNDILYESGTDRIKKEDYQLVREISELLVMEPQREITISGHTDNVPIHNKNFESNWHLSVMRSVNFMKLLLENNELDAKWFSVKGHGEFKPIATNETAEGRRANRRVEILIKANEKDIEEIEMYK